MGTHDRHEAQREEQREREARHGHAQRRQRRGEPPERRGELLRRRRHEEERCELQGAEQGGPDRDAEGQAEAADRDKEHFHEDVPAARAGTVAGNQKEDTSRACACARASAQMCGS